VNDVPKLKLILAFVLVGLLTAVAGAGGMWWYFKKPAKDDAKAVALDTQEYKYLSLDKVIVMLRGREGEPMSHYLAVDLVFKTPVKTEREAKEQLPLLRSVVVKALSAYTLDKAGMMSVDQFADDINKAFTRSYAEGHSEKPFTQAMIGKLIIE
jgi:flagellar FliL protein